jgi:hypothetical protein
MKSSPEKKFEKLLKPKFTSHRIQAFVFKVIITCCTAKSLSIGGPTSNLSGLESELSTE